MSDLQVFPLAVPGGINQSTSHPSPEDLEELDNFGIFRGRVGVRAPITELATVQDDTGSDVDAILDIIEHENKLFILSYSDAQNDVYLHSMQPDGSSLTLETTVWASVGTEPVAKMVSFTGGTASNAEARLYISDYSQAFDTVYWVSGAANPTTVQEDLDADGTDEAVKFSLMIGYKFHLWGTGFWDADAADFRPEMIRFSQPGLVPGTDDDGTGGQEWFTADHRSLGVRGQKVRALSRAGDRLIAFQKRASHLIYGSGAQTWTRQELDSTTGCVGPQAVTVTDARVAYFWASDGPYRTDGQTVQYLGEPIRQTITEVDASETGTVVGYSPDDGLVYFIVSPAGQDSYHLALAFSHRRQTWSKTTWLIDSDANLQIGCMVFADSQAAPGPEGAPSSLTATADSDTTLDLEWANGDTSINTTTLIYRSTSTGFTPGAGNRIAEVGTGIREYPDTGLSADTEYFYIVRHERNNQQSSDSNEASDTTWIAEPSAVSLRGISTGIEISGTNNASGADIRIDRSTDGTNWSELTTLSNPGGTFSHDDTSVTCDETYHYRVRAELAGSTSSTWTEAGSTTACTPTSAPTAPSGLTLADDTADTGGTQTRAVDLSWTDESDDEDGFEIQRCEGSGCSDWSTLDTVGAGEESYRDGTVDDNTTYGYRVRAVNSVGESAWISDEVSVEPDAGVISIDASDSSVCIGGTQSSSIAVSWTNGDVTDLQSRELQRSTNGAAYVTLETWTSQPVEDNTSYADSDVSLGNTYTYRVVDDFGSGGENTGTFTSDEATESPVDQNCEGPA